MKHILLSALVVSAGVAHGQLFTDDFESYAVGDGISVAAGALGHCGLPGQPTKKPSSPTMSPNLERTPSSWSLHRLLAARKTSC